jgi:integrase
MRTAWVASGKTRQYCNRLTNAVVRLFKWAVSQELVDISSHQRLKTLEPLRIGETDAPETKPVMAANLDDVRKTVEFLPPQLRAVIRIQLATGARPSEILNMKPGEIDRSGSEWIYRPKQHKNAKRGKSRAIPLVGDAKEAVIDYLNRDPESYCFSPKEAVDWWNAQKRADRKSKVQPSQRDRSNPNATKLPRDCYDKNSLGRAIARACKKAGVPSWHPYQLRHLAGTLVRDALGAEAAQALLGHSNIKMTEHYAKLSEQKAIEAAKAAPKL